jgi:hypothetical protein
MRFRVAAHITALITALLVGAAVPGCTSDDRRTERVARLPEPGDALTEELMVALAQAKNFHHKAKVYIGDGNVPEAILAVRQILTVPFPAGAPEGEDVRLDARALLAKLLVGRGELAEAQRVVDEGLAAASRPSFFVANLWTVGGEVHEARAATLTGEAAAEARRSAIRSYDESIRINEALQKRLMEERP